MITLKIRIAVAILDELRRQGVLYDGGDADSLMMNTGEAADLPALCDAILAAIEEPSVAMASSALTAVAEAMRAEIARQEAEDEEYRRENPWTEQAAAADFNWEKAARTGLKAIRRPTDFMIDGGMAVRKDNGRTDQIWTEMVDRALGEDALSLRVAAERADR